MTTVQRPYLFLESARLQYQELLLEQHSMPLALVEDLLRLLEFGIRLMGAGIITASTCNQAAYDTKIRIFTGTYNSTTCVGGADDAAGCAGFTTEFSWMANTYLYMASGLRQALSTLQSREVMYRQMNNTQFAQEIAFL
ncbi:MAG: hypothetical protein P8M19_03255 [Crocinitomicaceae bacterium]|nr:hypothetical protein [Crocinitomicaceae bacterium]MDG2440665.1 hypothetical protein [Crocinitomicaceae bacterium]